MGEIWSWLRCCEHLLEDGDVEGGGVELAATLQGGPGLIANNVIAVRKLTAMGGEAEGI